MKLTFIQRYDESWSELKLRMSQGEKKIVQPYIIDIWTCFLPIRINHCVVLMHTSYCCVYSSPQCSYLDIYISRKIRLCKGDFEGKFQFNLQAKSITFLGWKFRSIILIFLPFFAEFLKSTAFYTLVLLFQRVEIFEL